MSARERDCASCGHPNSVDAMFCSKCGARLPKEASPEAPPRPEPAEEKKPARRVVGAAKTMLGMPSPEQEAMIEAARVAAKAKRERAASEDEAPRSAPTVPEEAGSPPKKRRPERRIAGSARTMLGMPSSEADEVADAVERAKKKQAAQDAAGAGGEDSHPRRRAQALDPNTNRTMLGQPAPRSEPPPADEPVTARTGEAGEGSSGDSRSRAPVMYPSNSGEEDAFILPQRRLPRGLVVGVLVVGVLAFLVGGGALIMSLLGGGSRIQASVVQGEDGEMLELHVPGAEAGSRIRFGGSEQLLEAGTARFPLSADDLALGDNELDVGVVAPDGTVEADQVSLHLEMRIRADVGPLQSSTPAIDVIVEAPTGSEVALDGEDLPLDDQGRATRRFPVDGSSASAEGLVEHVVRYRVQPPEGETVQGELRTRIPLTTMQIDRPGASVVTDASSVEVAGAVAPGSTVTIDGDEVSVRMGRFLHTLPLAEVGERTVEVIARAPGKAPHVESLHIRRVADMAAEAASFAPNRELTYARLVSNPATYRGQRVELQGVVYNVDVRNGQSVLQVLVSDCPASERCPVWVTYPAAADTELRARVRVLGTVAGEQQFRSQNGAIRTVPRVDATYILPASSGRGR